MRHLAGRHRKNSPQIAATEAERGELEIDSVPNKSRGVNRERLQCEHASDERESELKKVWISNFKYKSKNYSSLLQHQSLQILKREHLNSSDKSGLAERRAGQSCANWRVTQCDARIWPTRKFSAPAIRCALRLAIFSKFQLVTYNLLVSYKCCVTSFES